MKWLRRLIVNMGRSMEEDVKRELYDKQTGARNTPAEEMLSQMASSVAIVFRIDNGFMVGINMTDQSHLGQRGKLLYAKDAQEVAERMIAHETAFKIGVNVNRGGFGEVHGGPAQAYKPMLEYTTIKKGNWKDV